jgi:hypothetical protein
MFKKVIRRIQLKNIFNKNVNLSPKNATASLSRTTKNIYIRLRLFLINSNFMVFKYNFPLRFASAQWEGIQSRSLLQGGISCKVLVFNSRQLRWSYHNIYIFFSSFSSCCALKRLQLSIGKRYGVTFIVFRTFWRWKMLFFSEGFHFFS